MEKLFRELKEGRKEGRRGYLSMEEFYCFHDWALLLVVGVVVFIYSLPVQGYTGSKGSCFIRSQGKARGKKLKHS